MAGPGSGVVVTTSWDDGGPSDLRLAELLASHGMTGTFYWTVDYAKFPLPSPVERQRILDLGIEIGSHTMTHPDMRTIDAEALAWETTESKRRLEDIVETEVGSFCYPFGRFSPDACDAVRSAGYRLGRTTMGFRIDRGDDPFRMPVSIQMFDHPRRIHARHALKERNLTGLGRWVRTHRLGRDVERLVEQEIDLLPGTGSIIHLWGHSWELDQFDLWDRLDLILRRLSTITNATFVTNGDLVE
ncbi:MAG: polysaccharide deacetylase family protein [Acidimicrobiia bacterium]|nr:polysaccharide deacetylase family protein [Acidimicrobiia bacterium]